MFALELNFKDNSDPSVLMFVRRPQALIGATNFANVIIDDMQGLPYQIRLVRALGRSFKLQLIAIDSADNLQNHEADNWPKWIEGTYSGSKQFDIGRLRLSIVALDSDLILKEGEPLDKAGFRVLRQSLKTQSPLYPAVAFGSSEVVVSFNPESPLLLGRGRDCPLRIESPDVSSRHARIGLDADSGSNSFWIEDLGSTNGTYIGGERVTGRKPIKQGDNLLIARQIPLRIITSDKPQISQPVAEDPPIKVEKQKSYPCLISMSEVVKPARLILDAGRTMTIGRDPGSDLWIGAPHVSRLHLQVKAANDSLVSIGDLSTNGTDYDCGKLPRDKALESDGEPHVFDFGNGITVALVYSEDQEKIYTKAGGALAAFGGTYAAAIAQDQFEALGQVKLSDVSQLVGKRGRKATAHQMKALYNSSNKSTRLIIWGFLLVFCLLLGILLALFGASLF